MCLAVLRRTVPNKPGIVKYLAVVEVVSNGETKTHTENM
jgi:hypothetical protein